MKGEAKLISAAELFKNRVFKIPDYQRGYSWEKEQLEDLRKDIENLFEKKHMHFTGTIVAAKNKGKLNKYDIVDGQQRLTTLIILLKEIYLTDNQKYNHLKELYFQRGAIGEEINVLAPNEETRVFFNDLILNDKSPEQKIKSHACISNAKKFFKNCFAENFLNIKNNSMKY